MLKFSAFLFAALIFFVSFFYQEKKENEVKPILSLGLPLFYLILSRQ
jgi:hypothetical protein